MCRIGYESLLILEKASIYGDNLRTSYSSRGLRVFTRQIIAFKRTSENAKQNKKEGALILFLGQMIH